MSDDPEETLKIIAQVWKETIEYFGDDFPFKKDLPFKIVDIKEYLGKIVMEDKKE